MSFKSTYNGVTLEIIQGDITQTEADFDAIVNAANSTLLGGGGVDGAIHRAAGPALLEECEALEGCPTGEARLTHGHDLGVAYIIHAVGPIYEGDRSGQLLHKTYTSIMQLTYKSSFQKIAIPAISTGIYGYPC